MAQSARGSVSPRWLCIAVAALCCLFVVMVLGSVHVDAQPQPQMELEPLLVKGLARPVQPLNVVRLRDPA